MNIYINQIEEKIKNKIKLEEIKIIDNTEAHKNHKTFQKGKLNLILEIKSEYLNKLKRLEAEKILMSTIKEEFKHNIHALQIRLK
tara:strand:+ start:527 stop:781 length:255 start_codon:yes stop_codon:yes gene_type:complete